VTDVCSAPLIFAGRVSGIDSIAEGHWIIDFRRSIFRSSAEEF
jgi:hypothetical protein